MWKVTCVFRTSHVSGIHMNSHLKTRLLNGLIGVKFVSRRDALSARARPTVIAVPLGQILDVGHVLV